DKEIRLTVRKAPIKAIPFAALIALVSWQGAAVFVAAFIFHHWAWNKIQLEMHKPEQRIFSTWPVYKFLARHHCLHHRHLNRNFNVVFPLADYGLGTRVLAGRVVSVGRCSVCTVSFVVLPASAGLVASARLLRGRLCSGPQGLFSRVCGVGLRGEGVWARRGRGKRGSTPLGGRSRVPRE